MVRLGKTEVPSEEFSTTDNYVRAMFNPENFQQWSNKLLLILAFTNYL